MSKIYDDEIGFANCLGMAVVLIPILIGGMLFLKDFSVVVDAYVRNIPHPVLAVWRENKSKKAYEVFSQSMKNAEREYEGNSNDRHAQIRLRESQRKAQEVLNKTIDGLFYRRLRP